MIIKYMQEVFNECYPQNHLEKKIEIDLCVCMAFSTRFVFVIWGWFP